MVKYGKSDVQLNRFTSGNSDHTPFEIYQRTNNHPSTWGFQPLPVKCWSGSGGWIKWKVLNRRGSNVDIDFLSRIGLTIDML